MTISELQAEIERLRAERDALTVTSEEAVDIIREAVDIIRALHVERDEARAQAAQLAEALRLYRSVCGNTAASVTRETAREMFEFSGAALATPSSLPWLREKIAKELERIVNHKPINEWGYESLHPRIFIPASSIRERIAELRRED